MNALIFDMDETLAATGLLWRQAEKDLLQKFGHEWTPELGAAYKGMNAWDVAKTIREILNLPATARQCGEFLRERLTVAFESKPVEPMHGAVETVRLARSHGRMAVASGSPLHLIEYTMDQLGITDQFDILLSSESVPRGKPFPDVFLAAADALGAKPADCLVMEDSIVGAQAAQAAGMRCYVVPSLPSLDFSGIADRVFPSLKEITNRDFEF